MTKEEAIAFVERYQIAERYPVQETPHTSQVKAKQIASAYQAGRALTLASEALPFQAWQLLREKFNV